jgi:alpha-glucosidase
VHVAAEVRGRLNEDAGEGWGSSRLTHLSGGLVGEVFRLERRTEGTLPPARTEETLRVYGLTAVRTVTGAREHRFADGVLELRVDADWERLEVTA